MAEDSDLEKTEPASERRITQAREEGQVPRSREVSAFLVLLVSAGIFWFIGPWIMMRLAAIVRRGMTFSPAQLSDPNFIFTRLMDVAIHALFTISPLIIAVICAALFAPFILGSWNFTPKALAPDLGRINPIKGIARVFSVNGLAEMVKSIAKSLLLGGVAVWMIWSEREEIFSIFSLPIETGLVSMGNLVVYSFMIIVLSMILIVAVDVPFQLWQHYRKLRMTKEEVRKEYKEMEGSPEVRGRIRQLQREAARRRMMSAIPSADVIVTNPTHFSVALAYKSGMNAPKVLAKGMGEIALKIREIGAEHGIPILEAPPLARALYRHAEIDHEIPTALYTAVAEVLVYVYQLDSWRQKGGQYPMPPRDIAVPEEMAAESRLEMVNG